MNNINYFLLLSSIYIIYNYNYIIITITYLFVLLILFLSVILSYKLKNMQQEKRNKIYNYVIVLLENLSQGRNSTQLFTILINEFLD
jgi:hypothetical protein